MFARLKQWWAGERPTVDSILTPLTALIGALEQHAESMVRDEVAHLAEINRRNGLVAKAREEMDRARQAVGKIKGLLP